MKLPFNFPRLRGKIMTTYEILFDDDDNPAAYGLNVTTELPEWVIKEVYDLALKPKLKVPFDVGLPENKSVEIPKEFFFQKNGMESWGDTILNAEQDIFNKVAKEKHWFYISKHLNKMVITRKGNRSVVFLEILGEKSETK